MSDSWLLKTNEGGDWMVLYKNRKKVMGDHSLDLRDAFAALEIELEEIEVTDEEMEETFADEDA